MDRRRAQEGVTLIELLVALVLLGLVLGGVYTVFQAQQESFIVQGEVAEMNQNARMALEIMSREIRNACYDPTSGARASFQTADATTLVFQQDIKDWDESQTTPTPYNCIDGQSDATISCSEEWTGYHFDEEDFKIDKCSGNSDCSTWNPFVYGIQGLSFNYILADGTITDDPATLGDLGDIREVVIQIQAQPQKARASQFQRVLTSRVQVRNLSLR